MGISAHDVIQYFKDNPSFLSRFVDRLMLDELLVGECNSAEFFLISLEEVKNDTLIEYYETRIDKLKQENN